MYVLDKISNLKAITAAICDSHEGLESLWWKFENVALNEFFEIADTFKLKPEFCEGRLRLHVTGLGSKVTCFVYSKPVETVPGTELKREMFREV